MRRTLLSCTSLARNGLLGLVTTVLLPASSARAAELALVQAISDWLDLNHQEFAMLATALPWFLVLSTAFSLGLMEAVTTETGAHVNATSYNRRVLLTGEAPSDEAKKQIEDTVRGIDNVKEVVNEVQIAGASSYASRGADSLITSNVKARMVNNGKFSPLHVKVVTEAGVVYLMGLVDRQEADAAVEVARTTSGVSRVVKAFEYLP